MKIEIESLDELLALVELVGNRITYRVGDVEVVKQGEKAREVEAGRSDALDVQEENVALDAGTTFDQTNPADGQKPKRIRRTKEQIAADNAAADAPTHASEVAPADVVESAAVVTAAVASPAPNAAPPSDIEHLKLCREFISTHGMAKYEQSFIQAGLASNIMAFSDADRAKHVLALDKIAAA